MRCRELRAASLAWLEEQGHRPLSPSVVSLASPGSGRLEVVCQELRGLNGVCRFSYELHRHGAKEVGVISGEPLWFFLTESEREQIKSMQRETLRRLREGRSDEGELAIIALLSTTTAEAEDWVEYNAVAATPGDVVAVLLVEVLALGRFEQ